MYSHLAVLVLELLAELRAVPTSENRAVLPAASDTHERHECIGNTSSGGIAKGGASSSRVSMSGASAGSSADSDSGISRNCLLTICSERNWSRAARVLGLEGDGVTGLARRTRRAAIQTLMVFEFDGSLLRGGD